MKWSIVGLMVLGLIAAVGATLLVSSLMARADLRQAVAAEPGVVSVLVAKRALPAMSVVDAGAVEVREVAAADAPPDHLTDAVQGVGKVLAVPVVAGQPLTQASFVSAGSGLQLAAALPEGMRAVSVSLSNDSGMAGLIGPGAVVDVIASFKVAEPDRAAEAVSVTLLQGVQVLGLERHTVVSPESSGEVTPTAALEPGRRLIVTLMVDPQQAKALQLATQFGEVSLAMRNPLDPTQAEPGVVALQDLAMVRHNSLAAADVARMLQQSEDRMLGSLGQMLGEPAVVSDVPGTPAAAAPPPVPQDEFWQTIILRGRASETREFPLDDEQP